MWPSDAVMPPRRRTRLGKPLFFSLTGFFHPPFKIDLADEPPATSANELPQQADHLRRGSEVGKSDDLAPHGYEEQVDYESE